MRRKQKHVANMSTEEYKRYMDKLAQRSNSKSAGSPKESSGERMNYGEVVRVRVAPHDVMAAIDIVDTLDLYIHGMSLSQCVSVALKVTFESCRHTKLIPTRKGFEYTDMLARFPQSYQDSLIIKGRQIDITKTFERGLGEDGRISPLKAPPTEEEIRNSMPDPATHRNPKVVRLYQDLQLMEWKRDNDPDNFNQEEYDRVQKEFNGVYP